MYIHVLLCADITSQDACLWLFSSRGFLPGTARSIMFLLQMLCRLKQHARCCADWNNMPDVVQTETTCQLLSTPGWKQNSRKIPKCASSAVLRRGVVWFASKKGSQLVAKKFNGGPILQDVQSDWLLRGQTSTKAMASIRARKGPVRWGKDARLAAQTWRQEDTRPAEVGSTLFPGWCNVGGWRQTGNRCHWSCRPRYRQRRGPSSKTRRTSNPATLKTPKPRRSARWGDLCNSWWRGSDGPCAKRSARTHCSDGREEAWEHHTACIGPLHPWHCHRSCLPRCQLAAPLQCILRFKTSMLLNAEVQNVNASRDDHKFNPSKMINSSDQWLRMLSILLIVEWLRIIQMWSQVYLFWTLSLAQHLLSVCVHYVCSSVSQVWRCKSTLVLNCHLQIPWTAVCKSVSI